MPGVAEGTDMSRGTLRAGWNVVEADLVNLRARVRYSGKLAAAGVSGSAEVLERELDPAKSCDPTGLWVGFVALRNSGRRT